MNPLLLWAGNAWARMLGADFSARRRRCNGCRRAVHLTRRGPAGITGCTSCIPVAWAGMRHDHF